MAKKTPSETIKDVKDRIISNLDKYVDSKEFEAIADKALVDFIKRVKRGIMPSLGVIAPFESEEYKALRKKFKGNLGGLAKVNKSNATATGQMLDAMVKEITDYGFKLYVEGTARTGELSGNNSKLDNSEVAKYYSKNRPIFDFSEPERKRIIRNIKADLLKILKKSK